MQNKLKDSVVDNVLPQLIVNTPTHTITILFIPFSEN